jgi:hypothetical protein
MPKRNKRPCIRGLKDFQKSGCPEKHWDGQDGCPAWKEYTVPGEPSKPPKIIKDCIDCLSEHWQFEALKMLEGNQMATESFRNCMCEEVAGQVVPKMDRAVMELVSILQREKEDRALLKTQQSLEITD